MRTIRTKVYKFSELSEKAKERALIDHVDFLVSDEMITDEDNVFYPAVAEMEKMETPWFLGETIYHDYKKELIADIEAREYEFTADGRQF